MNEHEILQHAGKVKQQLAKQIAEQEYDKFNAKRIQFADKQDGDFEKAIKKLPVPSKK